MATTDQGTTVGLVTVKGELAIWVDAKNLDLTSAQRDALQQSLRTRAEAVKAEVAAEIDALVKDYYALGHPGQLALAL